MRQPFWYNGRWSGALIGAVLRGVVMAIDFHGQGGIFLIFLCLPSMLLGALCGAVAGGSKTVVGGILWGGIVSGVSFAILVAPIAFIFSLFDAAGMVEKFSLPYLLQRVAIGAIAGGAGAWLHQYGLRRDVIALPQK